MSLNVFSIGGQTSYYNLSVYPVNTPSSWDQSTLSFMSLQTSQASTFYTYNQAGYQYPYSPGLGGSSSCILMANVPPSVTACTPLVRSHPLTCLARRGRQQCAAARTLARHSR